MVTIKKVAEAAGVSVSTVSRALTGSKKVNEAVKKRIIKIVQELNYTPNLSARALTGKGTKLIGMVVPEVESNYYAQLIDHVETELSARGYALMIATTGFDSEKGLKTLDILMGRNVDGILYADLIGKGNKGLFEKSKINLSCPTIFFDPVSEIAGRECVVIDEAHGIALLVRHLAELGHRSIGFIGEALSKERRLSPFRKALADSELVFDEKFVRTDGAERFELGGYLRMKELIASGELPTAIIASYDYIAIGAMKALHEHSIRVPEDLSIAGYDNIRESEYVFSPLTTICPPIKEAAFRAVHILTEAIENERQSLAARTVFYPELVVRQSTGVPGKQSISAGN
ncbi:LacI family DNA-binding transcriptional regulator [Cohnella silvisoli]|uniref:LacI family DNA-binding transcriptional regulator n=1 Tax=Cohnella silvisoli TaxID=2873699 RepID=A0ABV1L2K0_9BACL|nr:LacI family DNA-binding transcriptional regulator [Cohnella silvisoli]MCD9021592.1 LacI family transcriptional regulator [Cohnella silvisoli]